MWYFIYYKEKLGNTPAMRMHGMHFSIYIIIYKWKLINSFHSVAFMLRRIWNKEPLWQVAKYFNVSRGWLQATLQSACTHSGAVTRFAERTPSLWALKSLLPEMVKRLSECKQQELIPLLSVECVKSVSSTILYKFRYIWNFRDERECCMIRVTEISGQSRMPSLMSLFPQSKN